MRIKIAAFGIGVICVLSGYVCHAQLPALEWAKSIGGTDIDGVSSIVIDDAGNVYTTGLFRGSADFDPGEDVFTLSAGANPDIFILKLDSSGNFLWAKQLAGSNDDRGNAIALDASGNVYTAGHFQGTVDFDPGAPVFNLTSLGSYDIFISKLDADGEFVWAKAIGGTDGDGAYAIATDESGNVHVTGYYSETVDFDPGAGTFNITSVGPGTDDVFILKVDASGNFLWAKSVGGNNNGDRGNAISLDDSGNVFVTGTFEETADFNPDAGTFNLTSTGVKDIFILKLDGSGNFIWAAGIGAEDDDAGLSSDVDASGNVYITGNFTGTIADFDPGAGTVSLPYEGEEDIFILKLDAAGNFSWAKSLGGTDGEYGQALTLDEAGNVYTTGYFEGTVDFDPGTGTFALTAASYDFFIVKLDPSGNFEWAAGMGGTSLDYGTAITTDAFDNLFTAGYYSQTVDFDPGSDVFNITYVGNAGNTDGFIQKLGSAISDPEPDPDGVITIYNAVSANGDSDNEKFIIENIELLEDTKNNRVTIYNRWGDVAFEISDYNNDDRVFTGLNQNGKELPSGTYYYKIEFSGSRKTQTGYLSLKR